MIAIVAGTVLGLAVVTLIWLRIAARHSERRSVRNYERALGALGDVAHRGEQTRLPGQPEPGRLHVRPPREGKLAPAQGEATRITAHVHLEPPGAAGAGAGAAAAGAAGEGAGGSALSRLRPVSRRAVAAREGNAETSRQPAASAASGANGSPTVAVPSFGPREPTGAPGDGGSSAPGAGLGVPVVPGAGLGVPVVPGGFDDDTTGVPLQRADPPTEAVETVGTVGRSLPAVALGQLVARSRMARAGRRLDESGPLPAAGPAPPGRRISIGSTGAVASASVAEAWVAPAPAGSEAGEVADPAAETELNPAVPIVFDFDELAEPPIPPTSVKPIRGLRPPGSERRARRAAAGAAAVVAVAAVGVGIWELATKAKPGGTPVATATGGTPAKAHTGTPAHHHKSSTPPPTTQPSPTVNAISRSANLLVFPAPTGSYTLRFSATSADCWVGAHPGGGGYVWQATVYPNQPAIYKVTGATTIRIGNARVISITLDGKPVSLQGGGLTYDAEFTPTASSPAK